MLSHEEPLTILSPVVVTEDMLKNLLCCAFEGGSNYWALIDKVEYPPGTTREDFAEGGSMQTGTYWHWAQLVPLCAGGALIIRDRESGEINGAKCWRLDRQAIERGLTTMMAKFPKHWADVVADNADADTGDCLLQCALFGDIVFA